MILYKKIKSDILFIEDIINKQHKNKILINTEMIESLINGIMNINNFIKEIISYVAKINTGQQLNAEVLTNLFNKYDENCKNINLIIKPLIQNYLPKMKYLLIDETETDYNIDDYDDSDIEYNEDSYDETDESDSETESESDDEIINKQNNEKKNNVIVSPSNFKPKYGQVYIKPIQINGQVNNGNYQRDKQINKQYNYQINRQINKQNNHQVNEQKNEPINKNIVNKDINQQQNNRNIHKNKIKTVNTQANRLLNMLISSYK